MNETEWTILLNKYHIKYEIRTLISMWNEPHRYYHTEKHLEDLIGQINKDRDDYSLVEYEKLLLVVLFHDIFYIPTNSDNEEMSAKFYWYGVTDVNYYEEEIKQIILDTKDHKPTTKLSEVFIKYDMNIVTSSYDKLLEWECGIYNEFSKIDLCVYKNGRLKFLKSLLVDYKDNENNLNKLIEYVKSNY